MFAVAALAFDSQYHTRFITSAPLTIKVKDGQYLTIKSFTQDNGASGQRGVIVAGIVPSTPTATPTATATATPAAPLTTQAGPSVALSTGGKLTDTATLFGFNNPTGFLTFNLFDPSLNQVYTDTVVVNGNGNYSTATGTNPGGFTPTTVGTYTWQATYSGDSNNVGAADNGQNETETVTSTPTPSPTPTPTPTTTPTATPIFGTLLVATNLHPTGLLFSNQKRPPGESIKPIIIAGPATLTIDPVLGATLAVTYRKHLQPIPTPTASASPTSTATKSRTTSASSGANALSGSTSIESPMSSGSNGSSSLDDDDDALDSTTQSPSPTPTPTPTPSPTATPTVAPSPSPTV